MGTDFKKARLRLVGIYLLIIASVVILFSVLTLYQATNSFADPVVNGEREIVLSTEDARSLAQERHGDSAIVETEYEIQSNELLYTVTFSDGSETKVNLVTGDIWVPHNGGFFKSLADDFDEKVLWMALLVFALAAVASMYVANQTLAPIAYNIRKQKEFVSGAAHELRNPLAALHARIEATLRLGENDAQKEVLTSLLYETKRLIALSEGLLSLEKGIQEKLITDVSVSKVVSSLMESLVYTAKERGATLHTDIDQELLCIDKKDLETILYNLVHNALKFTPSGGHVSVTWKQKTLTVSDTGIGIPTKEIPHIFDRFYKVDTARSGEGSGLGLALVKEVAEKYKAKVFVESEQGKGSIFSIAFK